ncbi:hypothetical protein OBBRIDRAFT_334312 [Obba rivulosa]|uniref:Uncharacterized protein n=1 Tax=Obba rivulosa TaxID=1052685 RepID=A0A8E2AIK7_9APHY|nr:hypothetical protein OBBRIDRAFT_334312 [Obba rivulosa]
MSTFPSLQDIRLRLRKILPAELSGLTNSLATLYLHRLELYSFFSVFSSCARSRPWRRLQEVGAHLNNASEVPGMLSLLQSCSRTLRKLEIDTVCSGGITISRDQLHQFATTTYSVLLELPFNTNRWSLRAMVELLCILSCYRIISLRFTFNYGGFTDGMDSDLLQISDILQQDRFAALAGLTIISSNPYLVDTPDHVRDLQTRIFAPFIECGIVGFEH